MLNFQYLYSGLYDSIFTPTLFIALVVGIVVSILLSIRQRGKPKTDVGFQLLHAKLSYRRKFIRGVWLTPLSLIVLITIFSFSNINPKIGIAVIIILALIAAIQETYHYKMWQKHET